MHDWLIHIPPEREEKAYILFLHGWMADAWQGGLWKILAKCAEGYGKIILRLPYADSETARISRETILERIREAEKMGRIVWRIGFSMGGLLASITRREDERLILISPALVSLSQAVRLPLFTLREKTRLLFTGRVGRVDRSIISLFHQPRLKREDLIMHAWDDQLIPWRTILRHAQHARSRVVLLTGGHTLDDSIKDVIRFACDALRE